MHELTELEIEQISSDIDQQGLTYTLLKNELLDHVCCDIEAEMENGLTFNEAYRKVKHMLGKKRIRQIQDETLYLISKKYRRMKRLMYILGVAVPIIIIAAAILRVMHLPGGGPLMTLALFTTGIVFLPVFVMVRIRDTRRQEEPVPLGLYLTGMLSGMITITGALLKIQHMAGSGVLLTIGLLSMAGIFLPIYAVAKIRDARKKKETVNTRLFIGAVIAGILFITGTLFKVMHWPGAGITITVSWVIVAILLLPLLVLNQLKQKENSLNNFFSIIVVISLIAILLMAWMRSNTVDSDVTASFIVAENNLFSQARQLSILSNQQLESAKLSGSDEIRKKMGEINSEADAICEFIQSTKTEMLLGVNEDNRAVIREDGQIDYWEAIGNNSRPIAQKVMFGQNGSDGKELMLKEMLDSFRSHAMSAAQNNELRIFIEEQLTFEHKGSPDGWDIYLIHGPMLRTATCLTMYQSAVRMVEYELLMELYSRTEK